MRLTNIFPTRPTQGCFYLLFIINYTEVIVYFINLTEFNKQNIFEIAIKVSKLWYFQIICRVVGFVGMYTGDNESICLYKNVHCEA